MNKPTILTEIIQSKQTDVNTLKKSYPIDYQTIAPPLPIRPFLSALKSKSPSIIAEIKKASPSKGIIRDDFDVIEIATTYASNGASALSILTEERFFLGNPAYLMMAKEKTTLPILRKDFIVDPYQIYESVLLGADAILLIASALSFEQLKQLYTLALSLGLAILIECHTAEEVDSILPLNPSMIGINNRNLHDFTISLENTITLSKRIPSSIHIICESGINTHEDIHMMRSQGIHSFLIGESLMRERNIADKLKKLLNIC